MAEKRKTSISRPKVRFSQSAESPNSPDGARTFSKPRIRSIVDLKGPSIKILKAPPANFDKSSGSEEMNFKHSAGDAPNDLSLCPLKSTGVSAPCLTEIVLTPENRALRTKNVFDTRETSKNVVNQNVPSKSCLKESEVAKKQPSSEKISRLDSSKGARKSCSSLAGDTKQSQEILNGARSVSQTRLSTARIGKEKNCVLRESKENVPAVPKNTPRTRSEAKTKSTASSQSNVTQPLCKTKEASFKTKEILRKTKEASCKSKEASVTKKTIKVRTDPLRKSVKEIGLMPCMKVAKYRSKSAPMKKTILRDVSSSRSNVYVGPGVPRPRSLEPEIQSKTKASRSRSEILAGDKLARPEYNSIVGTMKKLLDLRKEQVIKDLEHLPAIYRGLVNGKVSSALDFGANEAIYRDLVDLSIDEKQLPCRLTRSKDPEPRQRDLVPKLTDFFVPTNNEEYRKAVLPRPPSPRVLDISNPYKISDRIFAWKESLDRDL